MFELEEVSKEGLRTGILKFNGKQRATPCYFLISNFGGGGSDVYRMVSYLDLLEESSIPVLFNYYYLTGGGTFPVSWIRHVPKFDDIIKFICFIRDNFFEGGLVKKDYPKRPVRWQPITLLDSGSGNILRDMVESGKTTFKMLISSFESVIEEYHVFANKHMLNMSIAMDFAEKQTYKKGERENKIYTALSKELSRDLSCNLELLGITLDLVKRMQFNHMIYAPIHGDTPEQCSLWVKKILELEKKKEAKFDGFAVGDLISAKIVRDTLSEAQDTRPIHALGIGGISNIIPLVAFGVDTFDCNTPWRRATDGNMESAKYVFGKDVKNRRFSKFLIPAINSKGEIMTENKGNLARYVILPEVPDNVFCDCKICQMHSIREIKELYSHGGEDYYFARILLYAHAVFQHDFLCSKLVQQIKNGEPVQRLVDELPEGKLKTKLLTIQRLNRSHMRLDQFPQ